MVWGGEEGEKERGKGKVGREELELRCESKSDAYWLIGYYLGLR